MPMVPPTLQYVILKFTYMPYLQKPVWHELGTHVGSKKGKLTTISDGFYYVPLLTSIVALMSDRQVYNQVIHACM